MIMIMKNIVKSYVRIHVYEFINEFINEFMNEFIFYEIIHKFNFNDIMYYHSWIHEIEFIPQWIWIVHWTEFFTE